MREGPLNIRDYNRVLHTSFSSPLSGESVRGVIHRLPFPPLITKDDDDEEIDCTI